MASFLPDILDRIGKTPRELGDVHVHVESVMRGAGGRAVATVWLQAAFAPSPEGTLCMAFPGSGRALRHALPDLDGGRVVRWLIPFEARDGEGVAEIWIERTRSRTVERVRPPWKLLDTIEQPAVDPRGEDDAIFAGLVIGILSRNPSRGLRAWQSRSPTAQGPTVRPAGTLPSWLTAPVVCTEEQVPEEPSVELVWEPGRPLPPAHDPVAEALRHAAPTEALPAPATRRCLACLYEADAADVRHDMLCPQCGAIW